MIYKLAVRSTIRHSHGLFSARSRPMSSFVLDRRIFNSSLYAEVTNVWFQGFDTKGNFALEDVAKRWFMKNEVLDGICTEKFLPALDAIGPSHVSVPTAEPFMQQLVAVAEQEKAAGVDATGTKTAWTALGMVILLDQMPRNIFRTADGLCKVYNHYDKMALSLVQSILSPTSPIPRADLYPPWREDFAHRMWFYLPLQHSEDIKNHDKLDEIVARTATAVRDTDNPTVLEKLFQSFVMQQGIHREALDQFGRYPHRNAALNRPSTEEEKNYLQGGATTFGVTQK